MSTVSIAELPGMLAHWHAAIVYADNPASASIRWLGRQFIDGHICPLKQVAKFPAEVSSKHCIQLATRLGAVG